MEYSDYAYRDSLGIMHHKRVDRSGLDTKTSENAMLFDSEDFGNKFLKWKKYHQIGNYSTRDAERKILEECSKYLGRMIKFYNKDKACWVTYPNGDKCSNSWDNFMGIIWGMEAVGELVETFGLHGMMWDDLRKEIVRKLPLFHSQLDHPRAFNAMFELKYPFIFVIYRMILLGASFYLPTLSYWFLPLSIILLYLSSAAEISFVISAYETHKFRDTDGDGDKDHIVKTDSKIMLYYWTQIFDKYITWFICDRLVRKRWRKVLEENKDILKKIPVEYERNDEWLSENYGEPVMWRFGFWGVVFFTYFGMSYEHPITKGVIELEEM